MSTTDPPAPTGLCDECDDPGTQVCAGCRASRYCSKACQKLAWPSHKHLCKTFDSLPPRPASANMTSRYTRVILLDPAKKVPEWVWLEMEHIDDDCYDCPFIHPQAESLKGYLDERTKAKPGSDSIHDRGSWLTYNKVKGRKLGHTIEIDYRDNFLKDGSEQNAAIDSIIDRTSQYLHDWRGPIVAFGTDYKDSVRNAATSSVDLTPSDLRHVADYFNGYYFDVQANDVKDLAEEFKNMHMTRKSALEGLIGKEGEVMVDGLRINCDGDVKVDHRAKYVSCKIPGSHLISSKLPLTSRSASSSPFLSATSHRVSISGQRGSMLLEAWSCGSIKPPHI
jgi:hypothetical protein